MLLLKNVFAKVYLVTNETMSKKHAWDETCGKKSKVNITIFVELFPVKQLFCQNIMQNKEFFSPDIL